jgi:anionic cell wall polymer biosynthesis LytR-Cps2A-Psr (LCP) family protein
VGGPTDSDAAPGAPRRDPSDSGGGGGLSVADLLARNGMRPRGVDGPGTGTAGRRRLGQWDDADEAAAQRGDAPDPDDHLRPGDVDGYRAGDPGDDDYDDGFGRPDDDLRPDDRAVADGRAGSGGWAERDPLPAPKNRRAPDVPPGHDGAPGRDGAPGQAAALGRDVAPSRPAAEPSRFDRDIDELAGRWAGERRSAREMAAELDRILARRARPEGRPPEPVDGREPADVDGREPPGGADVDRREPPGGANADEREPVDEREPARGANLDGREPARGADVDGREHAGGAAMRAGSPDLERTAGLPADRGRPPAASAPSAEPVDAGLTDRLFPIDTFALSTAGARPPSADVGAEVDDEAAVRPARRGRHGLREPDDGGWADEPPARYGAEPGDGRGRSSRHGLRDQPDGDGTDRRGGGGLDDERDVEDPRHRHWDDSDDDLDDDPDDVDRDDDDLDDDDLDDEDDRDEDDVDREDDRDLDDVDRDDDDLDDDDHQRDHQRDDYGRDKDGRDAVDEPDVEGRGERAARRRRRDDPDGDPAPDDGGVALRTQRIDETLNRLTAIHAGLGAEVADRVSRSDRLGRVDADADEPRETGDGDGADPVGPDTEGRFTPPGPRSPRSTAVRVAALVAGVAVFLAGGVGWVDRAWLDGSLRDVTALDPDATTVIDADAQSGDQNYLLAGWSTTPARPAPGGGVNPKAPANSKAGGLRTVMLAHLPSDGGGAVVTSFPADLTVDRPSCDRWDAAGAEYPGGTTPAQSGVPLSDTYAVGGPRCLTKAVQQLTGLSINHWNGLDLGGLPVVVDSVHGVPLCPNGAGSAAPGGATELTGARAEDFVDPPGAANSADALDHQQRFLVAMLRKATSDDVLAHPGVLSSLVDGFGPRSLSDHSGLADLGALAHSLRSLDPATVLFATVPTAGPPGPRGGRPPAVGPARALFDAIRTGKPLPGASSAGQAPTAPAADPDAPPATDSGVPPDAVTVDLRNGSSRGGLAGEAADSLRTVGFTVRSVGDAPETADGRTVIKHSADRSDQAAALAAAVPSAVNETVPGAGVVQLVLGDSFDGQVRAAPSGSPAAAAPSSSAPRDLTAVLGRCG